MRGIDPGLVDEIERHLPAAQAGAPQAVDRIVRLVHPFVLSWCRARVGTQNNRISAEDVAQDVCLAIADSIGSYRSGRSPFLSWVSAITSNKASDAYRRYYRDPSVPIDRFPDVPDTAQTPETALLRADSARELRGLLDQLPERQQAILIMRIIEGLSAEETGRLLGMTPGSVRVAQHRALRQLSHLVRMTATGEVDPRPDPTECVPGVGVRVPR